MQVIVVKASVSVNGRDLPLSAGAKEPLVSTASHVCQILDCFSVAVPALTLTEIARAIGLRKSSTLRLLRTLAAHRYVTAEPVSRRYRLGERIGNCAQVYAASTSLASLARPYLQRLAHRTNETATLQTRSGTERQVVIQVESMHPIRVVIDEHRRYPLHAGAAGHVLRAYSADWRCHRDHAALARIRADGFAVSRGEVVEGAIAIYVPVVDAGATFAQFVVGLQAPAFRVTSAQIEAILGELRDMARDIAEIIPPGVNV